MMSRAAFIGAGAAVLLALGGTWVGIRAVVSSTPHATSTCGNDRSAPAVGGAHGTSPGCRLEARSSRAVAATPPPSTPKPIPSRAAGSTSSQSVVKATVTAENAASPGPRTKAPQPRKSTPGGAEGHTVTPPEPSVCTDGRAYTDYDGEKYVWDDWESGAVGDYYADADWWAAGGYRYSQHMTVCSHNSWYATVTTDDHAGDGAVKAYPNVHKDFHNWSNDHEPQIAAYSTIRAEYAGFVNGHADGFGAYDVAFDLWANQFDTEIMIWTNARNQTPTGKYRGQVAIDGKTWRLWANSDNSYVAFVPKSGTRLDSGTLDLKAFFDYLAGHGRLSAKATLSQIDYGVEVVSTNGRPERFDFTRFEVSAS